MPEMSTRLRLGGAFGYLLLIATLVLGVFAMHTLGHPEHSSGPAAGGVHHAASAAQHDGMAAATADDPAPGTPSADEPVTVMDVLSVCVAVLTGWLLGLFLCAAAGRRDRLAAPLARAPAVRRRSAPPPSIPLLAQLSVLRI
ncbi:DUF6153 family protein [Streptomyces sp. NPDC058739]|uniref:DUF6153 family protein n=1 Tax=Streptomyces sp. NPDC058739 TaxID=3346618 RepID=UPI0036C9290E